LVEQWQTPCSTDFDAINKVSGKQKHWEAVRAQGLRERHAGEAAALEHMKAHNAAVLSPVDAEAARVERGLDRAAAKETEDFTALSGGKTPQAPSGPGVSMEEMSQL
jgi:hypothetical protein